MSQVKVTIEREGYHPITFNKPADSAASVRSMAAIMQPIGEHHITIGRDRVTITRAGVTMPCATIASADVRRVNELVSSAKFGVVRVRPDLVLTVYTNGGVAINQRLATPDQVKLVLGKWKQLQ